MVHADRFVNLKERAAPAGARRTNGREAMMFFVESFNDRTKANMEVALERGCESLPINLRSDHGARKRIGEKIVECAEAGRRTLHELTVAAKIAAAEFGSE